MSAVRCLSMCHRVIGKRSAFSLQKSSRVSGWLSFSTHRKSLKQDQVVTTYDKGTNWRDWFEAVEYKNAWSDDIEPLPGGPALDNQSRMALDLLNKLYQVGLTTTVDRITTSRIHSILQQLEDMSQQDSNSMWQRAERGRILLEAMENFEELRDEPDLPLALPLPTHETYWRVLRMYSSKFLSGTTNKKKKVPQTCHNIVQRMVDSGRLELQPTAVHWNQVLSAFANSSDEKRPINVATLLYDLDSKGLTDGSSFSHALRSCSAIAARGQKATPSFVETAIPIASRIWMGLKKSRTIDMQSFHFTHMLRVFRQIKNFEERDRSVERVFEEAIQSRKVNIHVLNEFLAAASKDLQSKVLGVKNMMLAEDPAVLVREIPKEWLEEKRSSGESALEW